jgi:hypothetical protein
VAKDDLVFGEVEIRFLEAIKHQCARVGRVKQQSPEDGLLGGLGVG